MTDEQAPSQPQHDDTQDAGADAAQPQDAGADAAQPQDAGAGAAQAPPLPPDLQAANASKDERTWGMVAHLAALGGFAIPTFGSIIGPLIVWLVKREESAFVAYHAKQSMWFQIFAAIAETVLALLGFCTCLTTALLAIAVGFGAMGYAIYGAIQVSGGKDFEYYWVGPWVRESA